MIHFEQQRDAIDRGPSCLVMLAEHYGQKVNRNQLRECCALDKAGCISPWHFQKPLIFHAYGLWSNGPTQVVKECDVSVVKCPRHPNAGEFFGSRSYHLLQRSRGFHMILLCLGCYCAYQQQ